MEGNKKISQNVSVKSVDELLDFLPDDEVKMLSLLRRLVLECIPNCTEKISYNVPFYRRSKAICFIWPSSVLWGKTISFSGVRFGFNYGYLMRDELNFLERGNRKQVFWKDFKTIKEIDTDLLKVYLFEADEIDRNW